LICWYYLIVFKKSEVFSAVTMMNTVYMDAMQGGSCENRRYGGTYRLLPSVFQLLVAANFVPSSPIFVSLKMKAIRSFETSVLTIATRRNTPEDDILYLIFDR
jgi:hypothetical protein